MKLIRYTLVCVICNLAISSYGQVTIRGTIIDKHSKQAVENAHIYEDKGGAAVISDSLGNFQIEVPDLPAFMSFSHLSYHPKAMMVHLISDKGLVVELTSKNFKINEVVVIAERVQKFFKKESFYVREMEFGDGFLWVIGYPDKNVLKPELRVLSLGGTSLAKTQIDNSATLFRDAFGEVHIVYDDILFQLFWDWEAIQEIHPYAKDGSEEFLFNLQASTDSHTILRRSVETGVYKEFVAFSYIDSRQVVIHRSFDHDLYRSDQVAKNFKFGTIPTVIYPPWGPVPRDQANPDPTGAFVGYGENRLLLHTPINCKLFRIGDALIIFEDKGPYLWKYGLDFALHDMLPVQLPDRSIKIDFLQDAVTSQFYLMYEIKGLEYISRLNIDTGELMHTRQLDGFTFVDNVRVYGNRVYYLDQSKSGTQTMNLFSMEID